MSSIRLARRTLAAALSIAATLAITPAARAQAPIPPFGRAGQVVLDDLIGLRTSAPGYLGQLGHAPALGAGAVGTSGPGYAGILGYGHYASSSGGPFGASIVSDTVWFAPALDVFVAPRLSLGAALGVAYNKQTTSYPEPAAGLLSPPTSIGWTLSAVPRIGYVWPVAPRLAIWPRLAFGYAHSRYEQQFEGAGPVVTGSSTWIGGLDVKVIFQATRNVYFSVAPALAVRHVTTDFGTDVTRNFLVGLGGTVGMGVVL